MTSSSSFSPPPPDAGAAAAKDAPPPADALKRELGLWDLTAVGVGGIVGAGVYVLSGQAAALFAGPAVVLSFVLSGVACGFSALCYAELASIVTSSAGSAYAFATAILGPEIGWLIGWDLLLEYLFGAATVAVGWSSYVQSLLKDGGVVLPLAIAGSPWAYDPLADAWSRSGSVFNLPAALVCLLLTWLLVRGVRESAQLNNIVVVLKIGVLLLFVCVGAGYVKPANWEPFVPPEEGPGRFGASGVLRGSAVIFFAYIGFDAISTAAAEARDPQRTVPLATLLSLGISTALYIAVALVMTGMVSYKLLDVPDPIAVALDSVGGESLRWVRPVVKVGAILGLTSVVMVQMLGQARVLFAMAEDGLLPPALARVHPTFRTPHVATALTGGCAALISGLFPLEVLGELVSIGTLLAFCVVCAATAVLRRTQPQLRRPFRAPLSDPRAPVVPALGVLLSFVNMCALPASTWLRLFVWILVGALVYFGYSRHRAKPYAARRARLLGFSLEAGSPDAAAGGGASPAASEAADVGLGGADSLALGPPLTFMISPLAAAGAASAASAAAAVAAAQPPSRQERVDAQLSAAAAR
jgi:APA family basic amino acid/polyamine antiporter